GDNAWGFQFHLEVDEPMIERWLRIPIMRDEMDSDADTEHADVILRNTAEHIEAMKVLGDRVFGGFLERFGARRRFATLPSR
ncbi:MAG: GMP synthase (glutamine-hydrolyzing), partial [Candidatus Binatia bacterium]